MQTPKDSNTSGVKIFAQGRVGTGKTTHLIRIANLLRASGVTVAFSSAEITEAEAYKKGLHYMIPFTRSPSVEDGEYLLIEGEQ